MRRDLPMLELSFEDGRWFGRCAALGIVTSAETSKEAGATLVAKVEAWFAARQNAKEMP